MNFTSDTASQNSTKKNFNVPRPIGCCAGQVLGCGFSFLASWVVAWLLSALLTPLLWRISGRQYNNRCVASRSHLWWQPDYGGWTLLPDRAFVPGLQEKGGVTP